MQNDDGDNNDGDNNCTNMGLVLLGGVALGAGLMYLLDPDGGRRRRALVRDQAVHLGHETQDMVEGKAKDLSNRAQGVVAEARSAAASVLHSEAENGAAE